MHEKRRSTLAIQAPESLEESSELSQCSFVPPLLTQRRTSWPRLISIYCRYVRYTFFCGYGPFSWCVKCRFSDIQRLYARLLRAHSANGDATSTAAPLAVGGLRVPTNSYTTLPQWHETRPAFLAQRHGEVTAFLQGLASSKPLWRHPAVKEFFEVRSVWVRGEVLSRHRLSSRR
jgi:hypothetical protein